MIVQKDLLSMEFYKKAVYTGSEGNMRFRIERVEVPKDSYDPITGIVVPKTVEDLDDSEEGEGDAASADDASEDLPPVEMIKLLMATIWRGPYAFAHTTEPKTSHWAEFSDEGMSKLVAWMTEAAHKYQH